VGQSAVFPLLLLLIYTDATAEMFHRLFFFACFQKNLENLELFRVSVVRFGFTMTAMSRALGDFLIFLFLSNTRYLI
jgi:hypothetical protein